MPHFISLNQAIAMNARYRNLKESILAAGQDPNVLPICETFDRDIIDKVLRQEGCVKLRFYFGMDDSNLIRLVVAGVDENDEDMLPLSPDVEESDEGENQLFENGSRCPVTCPPGSPLNS